MESKKIEILEKAAYYIGVLKCALKFNSDEATMNLWRGYINGLLEAATIITGKSYDWDGDGIYEDHSNEPIVKA